MQALLNFVSQNLGGQVNFSKTPQLETHQIFLLLER